jgi:hypothetical protein
MNDRRSLKRQLIATPFCKPRHDFAMLNGLGDTLGTKTEARLAS